MQVDFQILRELNRLKPHFKFCNKFFPKNEDILCVLFFGETYF